MSRADTPAANTPFIEPASPDNHNPTTPYNNPPTPMVHPSVATPGAYGNTPGAEVVATPYAAQAQTPYVDEIVSADSSYTILGWERVDVVVRIVANGSGSKFMGGSFDGLDGIIVGIDGANVKVKVGDDTMEVAVGFLEPVRPSKRDGVVVTGGELEGRTGILWTTDSETCEGIVNFRQESGMGDTPSRVVKLVYLAKRG
jgi:hypothetical protein